jgi:hypothetical protein
MAGQVALSSHVGGALHDAPTADLQLPNPPQLGPGPPAELAHANREVVPVPGVEDRGEGPRRVADADPGDDLVALHVHRLLAHADEVGPVGERQAVEDLHSSGWNSPNSKNEGSMWSIALSAWSLR